MLRVEGFVGCQVIRDGGCGFAKHVRHDGVERDIADGKSVLKAVFLTAPHRDEFATVSCELTQDADVLTGDKAAFNETDTEQVTNPLGILGIVLVSLYSFHPFGVGDNDPDAAPLKDVENRHPVFAGGLHADVEAVVFMEPVGKVVKTGIERGKTLLLIARL